ncbi:anhydro-N-acetylmuramic acid kinase [Flexibacterium corallicola]|uniref:anhydro-N-acetylmuramic acid kinase n=1 Tax=Flexibacterium corallicola TaxID=3037259 RepID=UPI00286F4358|nr:anhydro-N-acetylmuramic acid kinase [Pseudovibrio sp. M1P-2-3]
MQSIWAIGLMTGTVLDGNIDIAAIKTNGSVIEEFGPSAFTPYTNSTLSILQEASIEAGNWNFNGPEPEIFKKAERLLTLEQTASIQNFITEHGLTRNQISIIGFHGQTVLHRPPTATKLGATRQLGDGQLMAATLGIPVCYDFRSLDVAAGGHGAPLAAIYHQALLLSSPLPHSPADCAVLNLGGVGNITWWDGGDQLIAFDCGPANAPINDWVKNHSKGNMDRDGVFADQGIVDEERLASLLEAPFFYQAPPKSLDRNSFTHVMASNQCFENGAAFLTAFSASCVAKGLDLLPSRPRYLYICGGGRKNHSLLREIAKRCQVEVKTAEDIGWNGDFTEAECFAFLAVRSKAGLPISFPNTTGAPHPLRGGKIADPL